MSEEEFVRQQVANILRTSERWLYLHGAITDGERAKIAKRIERHFPLERYPYTTPTSFELVRVKSASRRLPI